MSSRNWRINVGPAESCLVDAHSGRVQNRTLERHFAKKQLQTSQGCKELSNLGWVKRLFLVETLESAAKTGGPPSA